MKKKGIGTITGMALVIANMIGTGVFTSLGYQLVDLSNTYTILILWVLGGVFALAGAFSYAEVGTHVPQSGGEYTFLSRLFHPFLGYLAGWISITVGFAAPIAIAAIAVSEYVPISGVSGTWMAVGLVTVMHGVHSFNLKISAAFQNVSTALKLLVILIFIAFGFWIQPGIDHEMVFAPSIRGELLHPAFAVALIYVTYSYSGWNAAAYITEEFADPRRSLPRALVGGTIIVTLLYTVLQYVFLRHAPQEALVGQVEVGAVVAGYLFSESVAVWVGRIIALLLISSMSAMVWVGPRVVAKMGQDFRLWTFFSQLKGLIPVRALVLQWGITVVLLFTGTFEQILIYCGILLSISSMLTVAGVFVIRNRSERARGRFESPLYPFFQVFFVGVSVWMIIFTAMERPWEVMLGMSNVGVGILFYMWDRKTIS
jgi:APA family basic amino acid/polyamine antiporter